MKPTPKITKIGTHHIDIDFYYGESIAYSIMVKWDGCVNVWRYFNGETSPSSTENVDYMHLCGIQEFIDILNTAKQLAIEHMERYEGD